MSRLAGAAVVIAVLAVASPPARAADFDHRHSTYERVLRAHVREGWVDYAALRADPADLKAYVASLAKADPKSFSRDQALAFWINAYNALTLSLIVERAPKKSITEIDEPWDLPMFDAGGRTLSLNQIEHEIIRPTFGEPRIHVALVCAARSCPILESRPFLAEGIAARLDAAARRFARDAERNRYDAAAGVLRVSKIFEWYGDDFIAAYAPEGTRAAAAILGYFRRYLDVAIPATVRIEPIEYDWGLNGR